MTAATEVRDEMGVPEAWVELLRQQSAGAKSWLEMWRPYQSLLPEVDDFLQHKVRGICLLLKEPQPPSLLYVYSRGKDLYFFRGWPPLGDRVPKGKEEIWACLLPGLQQFYRELHDGWTQLASDAMGPLPVKDIGYLSDQDWELEPDEKAQLPFRLRDVITVFGNGGGDLLGLDITHGVRASESQALAWWHEEPLAPMLNKNFWGLMGAWIGGQVEDVDLAP
ncbi:hypothetical protein [Hymenobacter psoromatis]|uniref:hypothetical protein n=1 Tax=Hymenobacter psoromatis TaxID=1484116 RepID=UPI001CBB89FC|nr:hypothetical protein [Hymenobacter psoromatis]